ncbi:GntR family transcriptional regulator [Chenggangzhangella methanolivorans]|uniref:GntR family transcriptional regulator n=1 Tax=Chenggangzhangella methanolivorans TaxID=1437009 RepID=UPI0021BD03ED|nr:GntR family transcriptional regulator [Chenggangzhangella methanolivorans]
MSEAQLSDLAHTRTDRLVRDLSDAIMSGEFEPGDRLDEHSLADRFGVSRTPVREALRQLATSGLVEVRPRRGAVVASLTADRLAELFGAMAELEATCSRLSAIGMSPVERRRLEAHHESMSAFVTENDPEGFAAANLTFHTMIYAGAHNGPLAEMAAGLRQRLLPYRRAQFHTPGRLPGPTPNMAPWSRRSSRPTPPPPTPRCCAMSASSRTRSSASPRPSRGRRPATA